MYKDSQFYSILIVKLSSLGDIIQSLHVINYLQDKFPHSAIDWAASEQWIDAVKLHPGVRRVIPIDLRYKTKSWAALRKTEYDLLFDLQGNCKSGLVTLCAKAKKKVGFGWRTAREWPNVLATHRRFTLSKAQNMRLFYLELLQRFFDDTKPYATQSLPRSTEAPFPLPAGPCVMVCPGSKWPNKQLSAAVLGAFLSRIAEKDNPLFLLLWGSEREREYCAEMEKCYPIRSMPVDKLPISAWHRLMQQVDFLIAVDSSAIHLCGTTATPTFSIFGPTQAHIFKPLGTQHGSIQGKCPYRQIFEKQCPILRTCPTGACMKNLSVEEIFSAFQEWQSDINTTLSSNFASKIGFTDPLQTLSEADDLNRRVFQRS